ncbi:MAG: hypothetical protein JO227_04125, partial [Acetobacteraceae bacterium]|nr:hypothetical protein [Acetobacteraceae bacterium]
MSATAINTRAAHRPSQRMRRIARRRWYVSQAAASVLAAVLVLWTITPLYNMVMVSLEGHNDVFSNHIWPPEPSLASFRIVLYEGYWYLEHF